MTKKSKNNICVDESLKIASNLAIKKFISEDQSKEFEFPSSLTSVERAYLHRCCQNMGLKTKSRGKGANRFLTVYKKEGSTIVQADATIFLSRVARQQMDLLLQRFPVSTRERQELLPPTERDRMVNQDSRDLNRISGRLTNVLPQVPPRRGDAECRQSLPIWYMRDEIIQNINRHPVVLITGQTGCGKTTQVPQFILDHCTMTGQPCRIICTQPRRLATLSVAERVSHERDEKLGQTVGFQIRLESRVSPKTLLTFCTTGVLLRTLMGGDASIATVTHIIVDEIHERNKFTDFLLLILRDLLLKFRNLKLILMSATTDIQLFVKYFGSCSVIEVPGQIHYTQEFFLEDVLKITNYTSKAMERMRIKQVRLKSQRQELASWCDQAEGLTKTRVTFDPTDTDADIIIESPMEMEVDKNLEAFSPEPDMAKQLDEMIKDLWFYGSAQLFQNLSELLEGENVPINYQHSHTGMTFLMVTAGRGHRDIVEQLLYLGANTEIRASNKWCAEEWASNFDQPQIAELLHSQVGAGPSEGAMAEAPELSEEDKEKLNLYQSCFNDERVDLNLILALVQRILVNEDEGAILVFLPGYDEIVTLREMIINDKVANSSRGSIVFTLHSQIQTSDQKKIFKIPPPGVRKIILSTNIAETSITINDIVFVINSCKVKEKYYDALGGVTSLQSVWVSQSSALQRRGRAGRCRPGVCYHLISRQRFYALDKYPTPEILSTPIHELCLQAKLLAPTNISIADFLARVLEPPSFTITRSAVTMLKTIDSLDPWEELTELGLHLLDLPIDPRLGKMVLYSVVLKCLDPILTIVCSLAYKDPFILPINPTQKAACKLAKKRLTMDTYSDHLALLRAFQGWQKARIEGYERSYCEKNYLSGPSLEMIMAMRGQLLSQLRANGFVRTRGAGDVRDLNTNSDNWAVVKAALCAGSYPNLLRIDRDRKQLISQKETKVRFHPSSILHQHSKPKESEMIASLPSDWFIYHELTKSGHTAQAQCCSLVSPLTVALVGGPARLPLDALHEPDQARLEGYIEDSDSAEEGPGVALKAAMFKLDDWVSFKLDPEAARLVVQLRQKWHALFLRRMHTPAKIWNQVDEAVIKAFISALTAEEMAMGLQTPPGIGQRPKQLNTEFCQPVGMGLGKPMEDAYHSGKMMVGHNKYLERGSFDSKSDSSSVKSMSSPCMSPAPSTSYSSCQTRYFVVKAVNAKVLDTAFSLNVWAFNQPVQKKILWATKEGKEVILIFSIQGSGHFQGYASFINQVYPSKPLEFSAPNLGNCYKLDWIKKISLPFQETCHLHNPWNENRKVQASRDGQELESSIGEALCKLFDNFPLRRQ